MSCRDASYRTGKALCSKLKELIPRQMFRVPIQVCAHTELLLVSTDQQAVMTKISTCLEDHIFRLQSSSSLYEPVNQHNNLTVSCHNATCPYIPPPHVLLALCRTTTSCSISSMSGQL